MNKSARREQRTKEKEAQGSKRQKSSARKNTRTIIEVNDFEDVINYAYHSNPITTEFEDLLYMVDGTYYYAAFLIVMLIKKSLMIVTVNCLNLHIQQTEQKFI